MVDKLRKKHNRAEESPEKKKLGNLADKLRKKHSRVEESPEKKTHGNMADKVQKKHNRAQESPEKTKTKSKFTVLISYVINHKIY